MELVTPEDTPALHAFLSSSAFNTIVEPAFPALTCTAQANYLTGMTPYYHGVTANGYFDYDTQEVRNWHQSAKIVTADRIFTDVKKEGGTIFSNCWWHSMYDEDIDFVITPRPQYKSNGGKTADIYTKPAGLRDQLQSKRCLGTFPLHKFWGGMTGIESSRWIADASIKVDEVYDPTLSLIYLPHLDYCLQKYGPLDPSIKTDLREIDDVVKSLLSYYSRIPEVRIIVLSEYGIAPVSQHIPINRVLRDHGLLEVRTELGGETLDCGASEAFALTDHQVAHIHIKNKKNISKVKRILEKVDGVQCVLDKDDQDRYSPGVYHSERGGDLIAVATEGAWFSYYYWRNTKEGGHGPPDFARLVAIHRKPGYDPVEMFLVFGGLLGKLYLFWKIFLSYVIGLKVLVDAVPLEEGAEMIKGSHGRLVEGNLYKPLLISNVPLTTKRKVIVSSTDVRGLLNTALGLKKK